MQETRESLDRLASFRNPAAHPGSVSLENLIELRRLVFSRGLLRNLIAAGRFEV